MLSMNIILLVISLPIFVKRKPCPENINYLSKKKLNFRCLYKHKTQIDIEVVKRARTYVLGRLNL